MMIPFGIATILLARHLWIMPSEDRMKKLNHVIYIHTSIFLIFCIGILALIIFIPFSFKIIDKSPLTILSDSEYEIPRYVAETDPALLEGLRLIKASASLPITIVDSKKNAGFYLATTRTMTLEVVNRQVYWHELGHHIWFWLLDDYERSAYADLHDYDISHMVLFIGDDHGYGFPSRYAITTVEEDFAETMIIYVAGLDDPFGRNIDPRRKEIIDSAIRRLTGCVEKDAADCVFSKPNHSSMNRLIIT
jgi:hypothetical protein